MENTEIFSHESERQRVIDLIEERKEFVEGDDGYTYFWPTNGNHGCFSPHELRWIADELDKRNAIWNKSIEDYFESYDREVKKQQENFSDLNYKTWVDDDIPF